MHFNGRAQCPSYGVPVQLGTPMTRSIWPPTLAASIIVCLLGNTATAYQSPITIPRDNSTTRTLEQSTGNISKDVELQTELYRDGEKLELRYRVVNHGKEAVILMNFITNNYISNTTNLNPAFAELQADGTLKIS
jgi:hypothetical protein